MSDLAYNLNGESFEVPATATGWRVRRMKQRGAPEVVYGRELGVPLVVPIEADLDELRRNVDAPGQVPARSRSTNAMTSAIEDLPAGVRAWSSSRLRGDRRTGPKGTAGIAVHKPERRHAVAEGDEAQHRVGEVGHRPVPGDDARGGRAAARGRWRRPALAQAALRRARRSTTRMMTIRTTRTRTTSRPRCRPASI